MKSVLRFHRFHDFFSEFLGSVNHQQNDEKIRQNERVVISLVPRLFSGFFGNANIDKNFVKMTRVSWFHDF